MKIEELLRKIAAEKASDLFIAAGKIPYCRKFEKVIPCDVPPLTAEQLDDFRKSVLSPGTEEKYRRDGSCDVGLALDDDLRFRVNFTRQQGLPALAARPVQLGGDLSFEALHLPVSVRDAAENPRGLILIVGAAGSGKSTTMAAIVNHINTNFQRHIVTIEDPIEYLHMERQSLITQREIGGDAETFGEALKNVVRESPDVIVIGEMRDLSTMQTAITAALTGHLVISTVHTADVIQAIERIINYFPDHLRAQAADDLSLALCGVFAQRLLPTADGGGMVPAVEYLKSTPMVRTLIAARDFNELENAIRRGGEEGMITFNRAIYELYRQEQITLETGSRAATNREEFMLLARGMESGIETFRSSLDLISSGEEGMINMKQLLQAAVVYNASDLILSAGCRPALRLDGDIKSLETGELKPSDTKRLLFSILTQSQRAAFESSREMDFALTTAIRRIDKTTGEEIETHHRFRINSFYQRGNIGAAIRIIPKRIPPLEELKVPAAVIKLVEKKQGLILVTGPTGHGKSTTLAAMIDRINSKRGCHIITIEDPIEYVHENKMAVIEQREVHADTLSFSNALKFVLRQAPDVILVGEMRDTETIGAAITAAETGHLVLATLHTNNAPQSIDRIIDSFPAHQQNQIRLQLSGTILAILSQRLIPCKNGDGRIAAFEVLIGTFPVRSLIREGKTAHIQSVIETSFKDGMITMDKALEELYHKNLISRDSYNSLVGVNTQNKEF